MVTPRLLAAVAAGTLLLADAAEAQRIRGRVLDEVTGDPITEVVVELVGTSAVVATDLTGTFLVSAPRPGRYTVHLVRTGYLDVVSDTVVLGVDQTANILYHMKPAPVPLEAVVAETRSRARLSGFYERMRAGTAGQYMTRAEIEARPGVINTSELLRTVPGIEIVPIRRGRVGANANLLTMRGPMGRCQPAIFIDGTPMRQFPESGLDDMLKPHMIDGVEIYTRGTNAPPQFGAPPGCGVILFWTRSGSGEGAQKWPLKRILAAAGLAAAMVVFLTAAQ